MKLKIKLNQTVLICDPVNNTELFKALQGVEIYSEDWNRKLTKAEDQEITFSIFDEASLLPIAEPLAKLQTANAEANSRWYKEYEEHNKTKKKLKELEDRINKISEASSAQR